MMMVLGMVMVEVTMMNAPITILMVLVMALLTAPAAMARGSPRRVQ